MFTPGFSVKVGVLEDFSTEPRPLHSEPIDLKTTASWERGQQHQSTVLVPFIFLPLFFNERRSMNRVTRREVVDASKKTVSLTHTHTHTHSIHLDGSWSCFLSQDSKFLRVQQVLPVSTFRMRDPEDLVLSVPFLQFLHALPLEYNYALYREIFQRFGTHYYQSGVLGGKYDLLYQYQREELRSSGKFSEASPGKLCPHPVLEPPPPSGGGQSDSDPGSGRRSGLVQGLCGV